MEGKKKLKVHNFSLMSHLQCRGLSLQPTSLKLLPPPQTKETSWQALTQMVHLHARLLTDTTHRGWGGGHFEQKLFENISMCLPYFLPSIPPCFLSFISSFQSLRQVLSVPTSQSQVAETLNLCSPFIWQVLGSARDLCKRMALAVFTCCLQRLQVTERLSTVRCPRTAAKL